MHTALPIYGAKTHLNFRRWSRKGFAVFASLGKLVRIATLKTVVSETLSRKDGASIVDDVFSFGNADYGTDHDPEPVGLLAIDLLSAKIMGTSVVLATSASVEAPFVFNNYHINPIGSRLWGFLLPRAEVVDSGKIGRGEDKPSTLNKKFLSEKEASSRRTKLGT